MDDWNKLQKLKEVESAAIRRSAKGKPCTLLFSSTDKHILLHPRDTVVLAHPPGGGMGDKASDDKAAYGCHACHALYDQSPSSYDVADEAMAAMGTDSPRRALTLLYKHYLFMLGHFRTLDYLRADGLVEWK